MLRLLLELNHSALKVQGFEPISETNKKWILYVFKIYIKSIFIFNTPLLGYNLDSGKFGFRLDLFINVINSSAYYCSISL